MAFFGRGQNKIKHPYTYTEMYKAYIADKKEDSPYYISYRTFIDIQTEYYKFVTDYIINGGIYTLPFNMGIVSVVKYRPRKRTITNTPIDWENTVKYKKIIRHSNDHSNYFKFMVMWNRATCRVVNKTLYRFIPVRSFKRTLAVKIKSGEYDFFEL